MKQAQWIWVSLSGQASSHTELLSGKEHSIRAVDLEALSGMMRELNVLIGLNHAND
jgi:hypothetical protein